MSDTKPEPRQELTVQDSRRQQIGKLQGPRLPYHPIIQERFGIDVASWKALCESLYPLAKTTDAVCLALAYCKARKLDIMKKPVHIVPMWNSDLNKEVETVWPAITEHRITAHRTGQYAGTDPTVFGPSKTETFTAKGTRGRMSGKIVTATVTFPEYAEVTVWRMVAGVRCAFPGPRAYFKEFFGYNVGLPVPNSRWARAPSQMLEKCAEAGALRKAFTEELGGDPVAEEMEDRIIQQVLTALNKPRPQARAGAGDAFPHQNETIDETPSEDGDESSDGEIIDGETGEISEPEAKKDEPKKDDGPKRDLGMEWLEARIAEAKAVTRAGLGDLDGTVRAVLVKENRPDLLPKWEEAHKVATAELDAAEKKNGTVRAEMPPAEAEIDPKEREYQDWKGDQYATLKNAKLERTVDEMQDTVLAELREEDKAPWVAACNAKWKELKQGNKK